MYTNIVRLRDKMASTLNRPLDNRRLQIRLNSIIMCRIRASRSHFPIPRLTLPSFLKKNQIHTSFPLQKRLKNLKKEGRTGSFCVFDGRLTIEFNDYCLALCHLILFQLLRYSSSCNTCTSCPIPSNIQPSSFQVSNSLRHRFKSNFWNIFQLFPWQPII